MSLNIPKMNPRATVWLARKAQQSKLKLALEALGMDVICHSPLAIAPYSEAQLKAQLSRLGKIDGAIFVSPTAVEVFKRLAPDAINLGCPCFGPGAGTAKALIAASQRQVFYPSTTHTSEAMLALDGLQNVDGKHFVMVAGESGRPLIEKTLTARGAKVSVVRCYQRQVASNWEPVLTSQFNYAVFSSFQAYKASFEMIPKQLSSAALLVTSQRLADEILADGFAAELHICADPTPQAIAEKLALAVAKVAE